MKYVALLRGINVGGNHKVEMLRLRAVFESLGCTNVSTYINSGNVIFDDPRPAPKLTPLIERAITQEFGFDVGVILRDADSIRRLVESIPNDWTNDTKQKTDVMFLLDDIDSPDIIDRVSINPDIERALYVKGALIWNIGRENVTHGAGMKLIKTALYRQMTVRNVNTARRLWELMKG